MQVLTQKDLWPLPVYEGVRDAFRKQVIALKQDRRIGVGPFITLVFENRQTVKFQVQEIVRVEKITDPAHVQEELDGFNTMLPKPGELSATLMVELTGPEAEIAETLKSLQGLGNHVALQIGSKRIAGVFEGGRDDGKRVAAVQYVRFPVGAAAGVLKDSATPIKLLIDHPNYTHEVLLADATRASLAADLDA